MAERRVPKSRRDDEDQEEERGGGLYFAGPSSEYEFIHSGCTMLDMVLGGGWPLGRMSNIIGDNSAGKTLLAIEACANFARDFPKGKIYYRETEAAFDEGYAQSLGLPMKRIDFGEDGLETEWNTIEQVFEDLSEKVAIAKKVPCLYIIDSLDALSDRAELKRKIDEGSYAMDKQKQLHKLFRTRVRAIKSSNMHLMVVSQTRQKIGVSFGEKTTVNGDGSLQFYASQRLKLAKKNQISQTYLGQKHVTGVRVVAKVSKNKIGLPHRTCEFDLKFGFGINDAAASLDFLISVKRLKGLDLKIEKAKKLLDYLSALDKEAYDEWSEAIRDEVIKVWPKVQQAVLPTWSKY